MQILDAQDEEIVHLTDGEKLISSPDHSQYNVASNHLKHLSLQSSVGSLRHRLMMMI